MALQNPSLPFGMRDICVRPIAADGTVGAGVDLPVGRTLTFKDAATSTELDGDDQVVASHDSNPTVDWDLEAGGISLAAYKVMSGGTTIITGVSPNSKNTYTKAATDARPYFQIEGQAISDSGGDVHVVIYRAKVTGDLEGQFQNGQFSVTKAAGKGYGRTNPADSRLYDFVQNESVTAIVP